MQNIIEAFPIVFFLKISIFLQYSFYIILFCTFKNILITLNKTADFATFLKASSSKEKHILGRGKMSLEVASSTLTPKLYTVGTSFVLKTLGHSILICFETCIIKLSLYISNAMESDTSEERVGSELRVH